MLIWRSAHLNNVTRQTPQGTTMTSPMYINSFHVFKQLLTALRVILAQADAHVLANSIEPDAFLQARLYPKMFPLVKQVQVATECARGISSRLGGVAVPTYEGKERTFSELDCLLAQTLEFLDSVESSKFDGSEMNEIVLRPGTPKERKLSGQAYLANYGLPQFLFHVTTTYAILRHNGVPIGKPYFKGVY